MQTKVRPGAGRTPLTGAQQSKQTIQRYREGRPLPDLSRKTTLKTARSGTIQRKVGFEAEMSVPTFGRSPVYHPHWFKDGPTGQKASEFIEVFLFGGLPYGVNIGENDDFRLTSDHNDLSTKGLAIAKKLNQMGYLLGAPAKRVQNRQQPGICNQGPG